MAAEDKEVKEGKSLAWLSYLGLLFLIPLLAGKDNRFAKFHAKQGMVLYFYTLAWSILYLVITIIFFFIVLVIPHTRNLRPFGFQASYMLIWFIGLVILGVFHLIGLIKSIRCKYWKCPFGVYKLSERFKF